MIDNAIEDLKLLTDEFDRKKLLDVFPSQLLDSHDAMSALVLARSSNNTELRATTLSKITPYLAQISVEELYPLWSDTLHILGQRSRTDLMTDLHTLEPMLSALEYTSVDRIAEAIQQVGRWW